MRKDEITVIGFCERASTSVKMGGIGSVILMRTESRISAVLVHVQTVFHLKPIIVHCSPHPRDEVYPDRYTIRFCSLCTWMPMGIKALAIATNSLLFHIYNMAVRGVFHPANPDEIFPPGIHGPSATRRLF